MQLCHCFLYPPGQALNVPCLSSPVCKSKLGFFSSSSVVRAVASFCVCASCTQHKLLMAPGTSKNCLDANNYFKRMQDIQQLNYHCLWLPTFGTIFPLSPFQHPVSTLDSHLPFILICLLLSLLVLTPYFPFPNLSLILFSPFPPYSSHPLIPSLHLCFPLCLLFLHKYSSPHPQVSLPKT